MNENKKKLEKAKISKNSQRWRILKLRKREI